MSTHRADNAVVQIEVDPAATEAAVRVALKSLRRAGAKIYGCVSNEIFSKGFCALRRMTGA